MQSCNVFCNYIIKLEGCIDDERQLKTAKRSQALSYHPRLIISCCRYWIYVDLLKWLWVVHFNSWKYWNNLLCLFTSFHFYPYENWIERWIKIETYQDVNKLSKNLASGKSNVYCVINTADCRLLSAVFMKQGRGPINCNLTGKPAIFDRQIQCSFFVRPLGGHLPPLPPFGYATVFRNGFRNNFVIFHRRLKWIPFLESVNYSTYDTAEALAVSSNILFVEFSRATLL